MLLIGVITLFVVEPVMGGINMALNNGLTSMGGTSKVILGMILGGMMAIDMGDCSIKLHMYLEQQQLQPIQQQQLLNYSQTFPDLPWEWHWLPS